MLSRRQPALTFMFVSFFRNLFVKYQLKKKEWQTKPVVTSHYDLKLLQRLQGRFWPRWQQLLQVKRLLTAKEKTIMRLSVLVLFAGLLWIGGNWAGAHRLPAPAVGGVVTEAVVGSPQFINPIFATTNDVDMDISRLVYSGLMRYDEKNRLVPDLAIKYTISQDKKIYTFNLRQDAAWHDLENFTARDIVFTFETIQNVLTASPLYISFQGVKVEAPDDWTVVFTLPEPYTSFLSSLTVGILPEHVWFNMPPEQMRLAQTNIQPVGTGPFRFKKLTKDESGRIYSYELARFDRYYRQSPFLEGFIFQFYPAYEGEAGAVQALRGQKVAALSFVPKNLRDKIERKHIILHTLQLPQYTALFLNQARNSSLKDKDVRLALAQVIDRERILREAVRGEGQVINSPVLPGFPGYDGQLGELVYNVNVANTLLDKNWPKFSANEYRELRQKELLAEWEKNNSNFASSTPTSTLGTAVAASALEEAGAAIKEKLAEELNQAQTFYRRSKKEGKILEINLVTVGTEEYKQAAEMIVGFWQEAGVKTNLRYVGVREFAKEALKNREYDALLYGEIIGSDPDQYPFWHSSQVDFPGLNLAGYVNRNVDSLLQKARESAEENEKNELYKKFQEILLSELPAIFLYTPTYTYALTEQIKGVDVSRIAQPADRFADITTWYIKTKGQWNFK